MARKPSTPLGDPGFAGAAWKVVDHRTLWSQNTYRVFAAVPSHCNGFIKYPSRSLLLIDTGCQLLQSTLGVLSF
jgi:hypothetical protein